MHTLQTRLRLPLLLGMALVLIAVIFPLDTADAAGPTRPIGWVDKVTVSGGQITVQGWTLDRDSTAPNRARLYIDGKYVTGTLADGSRPDVARRYPGFTTTGFTFRVPARDGLVCVYGINDGNGSHRQLGCRRIGAAPAPPARPAPVAASVPRGNLEVAGTFAEKLLVKGWAIDADQRGRPISVRFYVGDTYIAGMRADGPRADVQRAVAGAGPNSGFAKILDVDAKTAPSICAYGINDRGPHTRIGCFYQTRPGVWTRQAPSRFTGLPAGSGSGRRIVYSNSQQRVWMVEADGYVVDSYPVSGKAGVPRRGTYSVFSKSSVAYAGHDGITMRNMVRFTRGNRLAIGFHSIPRYASGRPLQSESQLGSYRSAGCIRQADGKAAALYRWAPVGTKVVVV